MNQITLTELEERVQKMPNIVVGLLPTHVLKQELLLRELRESLKED